MEEIRNQTKMANDHEKWRELRVRERSEKLSGRAIGCLRSERYESSESVSKRKEGFFLRAFKYDTEEIS